MGTGLKKNRVSVIAAPDHIEGVNGMRKKEYRVELSKVTVTFVEIAPDRQEEGEAA